MKDPSFKVLSKKVVSKYFEGRIGQEKLRGAPPCRSIELIREQLRSLQRIIPTLSGTAIQTIQISQTFFTRRLHQLGPFIKEF